MKKFNIKRITGTKPFQLFLILIGIVVLFSIFSKGSYISVVQIRNILNATVLVSFMACAIGFELVGGFMDLSLGAIGTMCGVVCAVLMQNFGIPWPVAVIGGIVAGGLIGAFNGFLVNYLHFQSFIATLAMSNVCTGLTMVFSGGLSVPVKAKPLIWVGTTRIADIVPISLIVSILFLVVYGIILSKTTFGRKMYLVGGNPQAARLAGINPRKVAMILFINGGALTSLSGIMCSARMKTAGVAAVTTYTFTAMTGALVGGISFGGGSSGMFGCFMGILVLNAFNNGLTVVNISPYLQQCATGLLLIIALGIDYLSMQSTAKKALAATKAATAAKAA